LLVALPVFLLFSTFKPVFLTGCKFDLHRNIMFCVYSAAKEHLVKTFHSNRQASPKYLKIEIESVKVISAKIS